MHDHIGHDLESLVQMLVEEAGMDDGVLSRRRRVQLAAEGIEYLGDLDGAEAGSALEQQVLDEVADAVLVRLLVTGARPDPEA
jgi:hypothetical protein